MANFLDLTTGLPALWAKIKSKFYTKAEVDAAIPSASSASPEMDGDAAVGVSTAYARADHIHPSDTSRVATNAPGANDSEAYLIYQGYTDEDPLRIGYQTNSGLQRGVRIGHNYMNIVGLDSPTNDNDAATKKYVDDSIPAPDVFWVNIGYTSGSGDQAIYTADKSYDEVDNAIYNGKYVVANEAGQIYYWDGYYYTSFVNNEGTYYLKYFSYINIGTDNTLHASVYSWADASSMENKANTWDVLTKTNTTSYIPTADYNPATKKYVDDSIGGITVPIASTTTPLMDGTAAIGSSTNYAKADHVHPSDTSKLTRHVSQNGGLEHSTISNLYNQFTVQVANDGGGLVNNFTLTPTSTTINNVVTPTSDGMAANKKYVDDAVAAVPTTVSGLTDTTISSPANGQILTYNSTSGKWENVAVPKKVLYGTVTISGTSATFSSAITGYAIASGNKEVIVRHFSTGDIYKLIYFESESGICYFRFNCVTATDIKSISGSGNSSTSGTAALTGTYSIKPILDTNISSPSAGQALIYDSTNSKWVNGSVASDVASLTDTTISSPADGQVLKYDSTSSKWVNATLPIGVTETRVNELIAAALAQYGDGDTATYGYNDASEVNY